MIKKRSAYVRRENIEKTLPVSCVMGDGGCFCLIVFVNNTSQHLL